MSSPRELLYWKRIPINALNKKTHQKRWNSIGFPEPHSWGEWFRDAAEARKERL